jgi:hypothetical protein
MTRAGDPTAIDPSGIEEVTTLPAPTTDPVPTVTPESIITPNPSQTSLPILMSPFVVNGCLKINSPGIIP